MYRSYWLLNFVVIVLTNKEAGVVYVDCVECGVYCFSKLLSCNLLINQPRQSAKTHTRIRNTKAHTHISYFFTAKGLLQKHFLDQTMDFVRTNFQQSLAVLKHDCINVFGVYFVFKICTKLKSAYKKETIFFSKDTQKLFFSFSF